MDLSSDSLQRFADRMHGSGTPQRMREKLEASLIPLVRRALRSGAGLPQLVQWVQRTLPQIQTGPDVERAALPLTRLLCTRLLHQRPVPHAATETVVGR